MSSFLYIKQYKELLSKIYLYKPNSPLIVKSGKNSDIYNTITKWCNIKTDLIDRNAHFAHTSNGILFSKEDRCFIDLSDVGFKYMKSLHDLIPNLCQDIIEDYTCMCIDIPILDKDDKFEEFDVNEWDNFIRECITENILTPAIV